MKYLCSIVFLFFFIGSGSAAGHSACKFLNKISHKNFGEINQFLRFNLVVMILVNRAENCVYILVCDRNSNVILAKEVQKELAKLTSVEMCILVTVILTEVVLNFRTKLILVALERTKLDECSVELTFSKVCRINHFLNNLY